MFLNLENLVILFEPHADFYVEGLVILPLGGVVGVLDEFSLPGGVCLHIHALLDEFWVKVFEYEETAPQVDHRTDVAVAVYEGQRGHAGLA